MKNKSNIESRENRRNCKSLIPIYISIEKEKYKIVPNILSLSVN